ncbi:hypothetical protein CFE70_000698 [Pyrenophora teres f. teres 0-1]
MRTAHRGPAQQQCIHHTLLTSGAQSDDLRAVERYGATLTAAMSPSTSTQEREPCCGVAAQKQLVLQRVELVAARARCDDICVAMIGTGIIAPSLSGARACPDTLIASR